MKITIETTTNAATLDAPVTFKAGSQVPVTVLFQTNGAPATLGGTPAIELALSSQSSSPNIYAYLATFTAEAGSMFVGELDGTDSRLLTYMGSLATAVLNLEIAWTILGQRFIAPNLTVTVQQEVMTGSSSGVSGPTYVTTAALGSVIAGLPNIPIGASARLVPITNGFKIQLSPDGGTTWQDGPSFTT